MKNGRFKVSARKVNKWATSSQKLLANDIVREQIPLIAV